MILRGISTPVQGEDAANKDYVDSVSGTHSLITLQNSTGKIVKAISGKSSNFNYWAIPVETSDNSAIFAMYAVNNGTSVLVIPFGSATPGTAVGAISADLLNLSSLPNAAGIDEITIIGDLLRINPNVALLGSITISF